MNIEGMAEYIDWEMANNRSGINNMASGSFVVVYNLDGVSVWTQLIGQGVYSVKNHSGISDREPTQEELWSCMATTLAVYRLTTNKPVKSVPEELPLEGY